MDIYLFNQGTNYEIYNKLGANLIEMNGVKGVLFGVWAPNAKRVSVIGDFNSWDGRRHQMRLLGESGIWEIFVPDLQLKSQTLMQNLQNLDLVQHLWFTILTSTSGRTSLGTTS